MDYNVHDCPCLFADKPKVSMRLGTNLDPDNLRTGNDVYFECEVKANPVAHRLIWLHNVSLLLNNFLPRVEQGLGQFYTRYSMYTCTMYSAGRTYWFAGWHGYVSLVGYHFKETMPRDCFAFFYFMNQTLLGPWVTNSFVFVCKIKDTALTFTSRCFTGLQVFVGLSLLLKAITIKKYVSKLY